MEKEDMILQSLTRIDKKLDRHEEQFAEISTTLKKLIEVDVKMQEHSDSIGRVFYRIEKIEKAQNDGGCSTLKYHIANYNQLEVRIVKIENQLENIKSIPNQIVMRLVLAGSGAVGIWLVGKLLLEHLK